MSLNVLLLSLLAAAFIGTAQSANILAIMSNPSPSHLIIEMSMVHVLAENGHNVTVVTTLKPHLSHKNINLLYLKPTEEEEKKWSSAIEGMSKRDNTDTISALFRMRDQLKDMFSHNVKVMKDPRVTDLYENKDNKFDLVVIGYFLNNFQIGIAQKLKVPVIIATSTFQWPIFDSMIGSINTVAFVPAIDIYTEKGRPMTFRQRLSNYITGAFVDLFIAIIRSDNAKSYYELYGDDPNMPDYDEINRNVSLVLFNSHGLSEGPIRPNMPAVIEVGGIQVKEKPDPLPEHLAKFLNSSTHGAILLSLGSNVQGSFIKPEIVQNMFNVLSKLKQKVIWKWENLDKTPGKSDNILYSKWVPQDDLLAHPEIKLFINHAGRGGITESQYHGKPMLSLPVFGDQPMNADKMVHDGFGLSLALLTLEEQAFRESILEILENPKYTENVKAFSVLFRDRPQSSRQTVLYWTEYVLRHHGAPHLQSPVLQMSYVEYNNIDVYALLLAILIGVLFATKLLLSFICRKLTGKSRKPTKLKAN